MKPYPHISYDGTFPGFLNTIQRGFEESYPGIVFNPSANADTLPLFGLLEKIQTDTQKAQRLWADLGLRGTEIQKRVYYSFLHENGKLQSEVYQYVAALFCPDIEGIEYMGAQAAKRVDLAVREVSLERGALERGLSFKANADGLWYSEIRPKHDILPLLSRSCKSRFPSAPWVVVDVGRKKSMSAVSGKLTIAAFLQNVKRKSRTFNNLQSASDAGGKEKNLANNTSAPQKPQRFLDRRTKNWEAEWPQQAV